MATYEELMNAARAARAEGRITAAQGLATRAYEIRTGKQVSPDRPSPVSRPPDGDAYDPTEHEGVAQEFFEGVADGGTRAVQGVLELLAAVPDLIADTDYSSAVTETFDSLRARAGIDPQGVVGQGASVITQFGVPGVAAAKVVGALSNAGRVGTFVRQLGAAGIADAVVSDADTTTLGDFFEGGPTQSLEDTGLEGSEEALRRIGNKFRVGLEGGVAQMVTPVLVRGAGRLLGETALAADRIPGIRYAGPVAVSRGLRRAARPVVRAAGDLEVRLRQGDKVGGFGRFLGNTLAALRYRGVLPEEIAEARLLTTGAEESEIQKAMALAARVDSMFEPLLKRMNKLTAGTTPLTRKDMLETVSQALQVKNPARRQALLGSMPKELRTEVEAMRKSIDDLSLNILGGDFIAKYGSVTPSGASETIEDTIRKGLGSYVRRRYRIFEDAAYTPDKDTMDAAITGFMRDRRSTEQIFKELIEVKGQAPSSLGANVNPDGTIVGAISRDQAEIAAETFLGRYKNANRSLDGLQRVPDHRLPTDLLISRKNLPKYQRALLGEIDDPLENYVATIADLSEFKAVDEYFGKIRRLADDPANADTFGRWFKDTSALSPEQLDDLTKTQGYVVLGGADDPLKSAWGSLQGYAVPQRMYRDLTRTVAGDLKVVGNAARSVYNGFLRAKGASQYGATVLSPITQLRNVTTAALMATMQGNVGRGANLWESMRLVFQNLPETQMTDLFARLQRLGVVGTQAELRELQDLISKGFGFDAPPRMIVGVPAGRRIGSRFTDNPIGAFIARTGKKAENLYQAGDDVWKAYNFQFERNKLRAALRQLPLAERQAYIASKGRGPMPISQFLDEEAANIVRNTVPNYNMVPESIRFIRKLPVGNFIAFPYEIVRTSINTTTRALEELASPHRAIQEIGLRRLSGIIGTVGVIGPAVSKMAYSLTGVSEDEMTAYQQALAPPWERYARLVPTGRHEDGTPKYINFSYSNPYDMIERTVSAALKRAEADKALGLPPAQTVLNAFSASLGEFVAPFTDESILTGALRDVLDPESETLGVRQLAQLIGGRAGQTITGAPVYSEQDSAGDRAAKSFRHVMDALLPAAVPINVRGGEFEPGRFSRGVVNALNLNEALGIDEKDARGIERDLSQELARAFTGITESENQASLGLRYRGFEFSAARLAASNIFNREVSRPNVQRDDILSAFVRADQARYRVHNRFYRTIENLRAFGISDREIRRILDKANVSGVNRLMRGKYEPLTLSSTAIQRLRENDRLSELPRAEINEYIRSRRNIGFGAQETEIRDSQPDVTEPALPTSAIPAAETPAPVMPVQPRAVPAPVAPAAPTPAPPPAADSPTPPAELLGGSLMDRIRNSEVAQRIRGEG